MSYTMWKLVTSIEKKEQAIVVLLDSLEGHSKAEKAVSDLTAATLHTDDGMDILIREHGLVVKSPDLKTLG